MDSDRTGYSSGEQANGQADSQQAPEGSGEPAGGGGQGYQPGPVPVASNGSHEALVERLRGGGGFHYGSDRAITNPPNWYGFDTHQLYNGATLKNDPGTVDATGQAWMEHGASLTDLSNQLFDAVRELGHAWVGQASGAAQGAIAGIARSSESAGEAARAMGQRMTEQAAAASEVKKMPPPAEFNADQALDALLAGGPEAMTQDLKEQADTARNVKAQQVAYCNAYTAAMEDVDCSTPSFGPESLSLRPATGSGDADGAGIGGYGSGIGVGSAPTAETFGGAGSGQQVPAAGAAAGGAAAGQQPGGAGIGGGDSAGAVGAPAGPVTTTGQAPVSEGGGAGMGVAAGAGAAALATGLGVGGAKALGKGKQTASKRPGERHGGHDAQQQGSQPQDAQLHAQQQGDQVGGHATGPAAPEGSGAAANPAASQPAAGQTGQPHGAHPHAAAGGMAPAAGPVAPAGAVGGAAGGAGGSGAQDEEYSHQSYLIEPDPDELFGPGEAMAPPVIGLVDEDE
ncbi:hypothetical protein [Haloechinothrix sp. LS1_15]|uniref:hypothetical protein n=1 Tax=Haloechinothrix sp. LS1_15 TaxID=2652248 RepID=UPI00294507B4|nr:hypothetical protein [Haloechinothrix sp. LS1_15]MDV6011419.1 hypothetical protein [Haloechinothrix sp. LS1_15]